MLLADLDQPTKLGETAWQLASMNGHSSVAHFLVQAGATPGRMAFQFGFNESHGAAVFSFQMHDSIVI